MSAFVEHAGGTFALTIELGNEAMRDDEDVAYALRTVADRLERFGLAPGDSERIRDRNGNRVGAWSFTRDERGTT